ncbi:RhuM family protein [Aliikangiella sp. IMCC44359]|uniref:RhuM family protein n=1 Tax=Aliikangiella sp. IMCC44359 TaxID=3459125 RepID=UPI00403ABA71
MTTPNLHQQFALYTSKQGNIQLRILLKDEDLWLTQKQIAELFEKSPKTISEHLKNIYDEGELAPDSTIRKFRIVQREASRDVERLLDHYNLEAIFAVGYRVRSNRGIQFRKWATQTLKEYVKKGFVMDDERLKSGQHLGKDYFDELLERIRDIRASERRFYQKITDIYATAIDYNANTEQSQQFFATVQNKLHFAIHGQTAAELIHQRADASKSNMGLTSWKGNKVRKQDVTIAKNYLTQDELKSLNRIVTMYLDYAENQASKQNAMTMTKWAEKLDAFLAFNEEEILQNAGSISHQIAKELAESEFEKYQQSRIESELEEKSDFDKFIEKSQQIKQNKLNNPDNNK